MITKCLRKPFLSGPFESDIGTVRDMSEKVTENKVYWYKTNGYKLVLPSGGPSGKYTKY